MYNEQFLQNAGQPEEEVVKTKQDIMSKKEIIRCAWDTSASNKMLDGNGIKKIMREMCEKIGSNNDIYENFTMCVKFYNLTHETPFEKTKFSLTDFIKVLEDNRSAVIFSHDECVEKDKIYRKNKWIFIPKPSEKVERNENILLVSMFGGVLVKDEKLSVETLEKEYKEKRDKNSLKNTQLFYSGTAISQRLNPVLYNSHKLSLSKKLSVGFEFHLDRVDISAACPGDMMSLYGSEKEYHMVYNPIKRKQKIIVTAHSNRYRTFHGISNNYSERFSPTNQKNKAYKDGEKRKSNKEILVVLEKHCIKRGYKGNKANERHPCNNLNFFPQLKSFKAPDFLEFNTHGVNNEVLFMPTTDCYLDAVSAIIIDGTYFCKNNSPVYGASNFLEIMEFSLRKEKPIKLLNETHELRPIIPLINDDGCVGYVTDVREVDGKGYIIVGCDEYANKRELYIDQNGQVIKKNGAGITEKLMFENAKGILEQFNIKLNTNIVCSGSSVSFSEPLENKSPPNKDSDPEYIEPTELRQSRRKGFNEKHPYLFAIILSIPIAPFILMSWMVYQKELTWKIGLLLTFSGLTNIITGPLLTGVALGIHGWKNWQPFDQAWLGKTAAVFVALLGIGFTTLSIVMGLITAGSIAVTGITAAIVHGISKAVEFLGKGFLAIGKLFSCNASLSVAQGVANTAVVSTSTGLMLGAAVGITTGCDNKNKKLERLYNFSILNGTDNNEDTIKGSITDIEKNAIQNPMLF